MSPVLRGLALPCCLLVLSSAAAESVEKLALECDGELGLLAEQVLIGFQILFAALNRDGGLSGGRHHFGDGQLDKVEAFIAGDFEAVESRSSK